MNSKSKPPQLFGSVKPNPNVIFRRLGDEIVLFDLASDRFYELNGTAARFWELLNAGNDVTQIQEQMLVEFAIDPEQLAGEAAALLDSLRQEDLIVHD
ncbi:MAG TPA: PqqD family protein [Pyrinomonadaceae bacterium]|nr:PqqD family protein [Pyrinomonadaceae bacterium]